MAKKPTGFVATCQCGANTGALDLAYTDAKDASKMLGRWLSRGCTVTPQFAGTWSAHIELCKCTTKTAKHGEQP